MEEAAPLSTILPSRQRHEIESSRRTFRPLSCGEIRRFQPPKSTSYRPVAVAVVDGSLYVADMANHAVDVYSTQTGRMLRSVGGRGSSTARTYYPSGLSVDAAGQTYVADMMNARVQVFDADGRFTRTFGTPGNRYGSLGTPKDIAVGPDGVSFVADAQFGCIHLFDPHGRVLMVIGGPRNEPGGTPLPNGMAIATLLPEKLLDLVPDGFKACYYVCWSSLYVCLGPCRLREMSHGVRKFRIITAPRSRPQTAPVSFGPWYWIPIHNSTP